MPTEHLFVDGALAAADMARRIAMILGDAIAQRGVAAIALSGGRSPRPVLEALSGAALDWDKVIVTLVDERWVAPDHADSNERLVRETLLQGKAAAARFVPMKNGAADAYAGQAECEAAFAALPWPLDIVLLGMGEDGHTASLFPGAAELAEGLSTGALTLAVTPPAAPHQRMSMSAAAILASRHIFLQIGGAAKKAVYDRALAGGPVEELPVRVALCQHGVSVEVWISE
ncbi:6-phosphogluconolactonase [Sphingobium indicum IP26]|uniref:6-phosphogluconolactonase n=1 Tax=Sphingobium indicum F2 TaxID=1450518 RepID=A0A8E0WSQ4_9SPHN|nr:MULTISPECIES: 6-phosphogluconolactonase [Sphingobium]EPR15899.1 6-phosphogluconolactonase [Sphingobium indicum IP26]EQB05419.1 6-phosphogluconolactonase [Sphingobium sp. HDIP04]KER36730.1 6-phosphogluconolactonase [Sphingobium indicum F2]